MAETNDNNTTNGNSNANSWVTYQRLILANQEMHSSDIKEIKKDIGDIQIKLAIIQTKSVVFGAIAGLLATGVVEFIVYFLLNLIHSNGAK